MGWKKKQKHRPNGRREKAAAGIPDFLTLAARGPPFGTDTEKCGVLRRSGGHSSRPQLALWLQQPTRGLLAAFAAEARLPMAVKLNEPGWLSPPIWPCTTRGFPCLACCQLELRVCKYKP